MTRFKKLTDNYTVIPNELFSVGELSAEAKFVYIYLRSKPPTWQPNMKDIERSCQLGRSKTMRCRAELIEFGLLTFQRLKEGGGVYTLHEITTVRKTDSRKPTSGFSTPLVSTERAVSTDIYKSGLKKSRKSEEQTNRQPLPERDKDLVAWAISVDGPNPFVGEDKTAYRQRLFRWNDNGRPVPKPSDNSMMDLPGNHEDALQDDMKRLEKIA